METKTGIKQSDFMREHGLKPENMKAIRDKHVPRDQWWKEGVVVYWSEQAARGVKAALFGKTEQANPTPEILEVLVIRPARNPRFVYADLNGVRITVSCPAKLSSRIIGKKVRVRFTEPETYQYEP